MTARRLVALIIAVSILLPGLVRIFIAPMLPSYINIAFLFVLPILLTALAARRWPALVEATHGEAFKGALLAALLPVGLCILFIGDFFWGAAPAQELLPAQKFFVSMLFIITATMAWSWHTAVVLVTRAVLRAKHHRS